jgi:hypothetical protein
VCLATANRGDIRAADDSLSPPLTSQMEIKTVPKFIVERNIPGASELTAEQLREITAKSNAVVAGLGEPYTWHLSYVAGDKIYCVHEAESAGTIYRHAEKGGFPADKVTKIETVIGPHGTMPNP